MDCTRVPSNAGMTSKIPSRLQTTNKVTNLDHVRHPYPYTYTVDPCTKSSGRDVKRVFLAQKITLLSVTWFRVEEGGESQDPSLAQEAV